MLGVPRRHLRQTASTNLLARALAGQGAPHGTLVTATEQTAGRGRQGRSWVAPPGRALLLSLIVRPPGRLLSLAAGVAVAEVAGPEAQIKWPNDVLLDGRKVAGVLVEARPQDGWAVLGIGLNVAVAVEDLPPELHGFAGTLGRAPSEIEPTLRELLIRLERWLAAPGGEVLGEVRRRDALRGRRVSWTGGSGTATGISDDGRLLVTVAGDARLALAAGEVHLTTPG
jgi:BirA family biotin operon repressor/biotin-[acetyl-CoA-carboxylase] ligase